MCQTVDLAAHIGLPLVNQIELAMVCSVNEWMIDSGAACHVSLYKQHFFNLKPLTTPRYISGIHSARLEIKGTGTVRLKIASGQTLEMKHVCYVPDAGLNLISVLACSKMATNRSHSALLIVRL